MANKPNNTDYDSDWGEPGDEYDYEENHDPQNNNNSTRTRKRGALRKPIEESYRGKDVITKDYRANQKRLAKLLFIAKQLERDADARIVISTFFPNKKVGTAGVFPYGPDDEFKSEPAFEHFCTFWDTYYDRVQIQRRAPLPFRNPENQGNLVDGSSTSDAAQQERLKSYDETIESVVSSLLNDDNAEVSDHFMTGGSAINEPSVADEAQKDSAANDTQKNSAADDAQKDSAADDTQKNSAADDAQKDSAADSEGSVDAEELLGQLEARLEKESIKHPKDPQDHLKEVDYTASRESSTSVILAENLAGDWDDSDVENSHDQEPAGSSPKRRRLVLPTGSSTSSIPLLNHTDFHTDVNVSKAPTFKGSESHSTPSTTRGSAPLLLKGTQGNPIASLNPPSRASGQPVPPGTQGIPMSTTNPPSRASGTPLPTITREIPISTMNPPGTSGPTLLPRTPAAPFSPANSTRQLQRITDPKVIQRLRQLIPLRGLAPCTPSFHVLSPRPASSSPIPPNPCPLVEVLPVRPVFSVDPSNPCPSVQHVPTHPTSDSDRTSDPVPYSSPSVD